MDERRTHWLNTVFHCFPFSMRFYQLSHKGAPVGRLLPFGPGKIWTRITSHYRMAFAFSDISSSHLQQRALRFRLHDNISRRYEVSTFYIIDPMSDLGAPWTPVVLQFRTGTLETCNLTTRYSHKGIAFNLLNLNMFVAAWRCVWAFNWFHHITRP